MAKIVNLNRARKAIARDAKRRKGDENAARFGTTKAQQQQIAQETAQAKRHLDGHKRDDDAT